MEIQCLKRVVRCCGLIILTFCCLVVCPEYTNLKISVPSVPKIFRDESNEKTFMYEMEIKNLVLCESSFHKLKIHLTILFCTIFSFVVKDGQAGPRNETLYIK